MEDRKRYLSCKYLDAGMDGMLCSMALCTTCKEFNGEKCSYYTPKNKMDDKLKPCPFCGGKAIIIKGEKKVLGEIPYKVICSNRGCQIAYMETKTKFSRKEAIESWNRRVENE